VVVAPPSVLVAPPEPPPALVVTPPALVAVPVVVEPWPPPEVLVLEVVVAPVVVVPLLPSVPPAQLPDWQLCPTRQAEPHVPQLAGSLVVSTHAPLHSACPEGQLPLTQLLFSQI
jgi:hypothetical protein